MKQHNFSVLLSVMNIRFQLAVVFFSYIKLRDMKLYFLTNHLTLLNYFITDTTDVIKYLIGPLVDQFDILLTTHNWPTNRQSSTFFFLQRIISNFKIFKIHSFINVF